MDERERLLNDLLALAARRFFLWIAGTFVATVLALSWFLADLRSTADDVESLKSREKATRADVDRLRAELDVIQAGRRREALESLCSIAWR